MAERLWEGKNKVAVVGVGMSQIGRMLPRPLGVLAVDASLKAIADAGLTVADIDGLAGPEEGHDPGVASAPFMWMVEGLGVEHLNWWSHSNSISVTLGSAINAIANNLCNYALVWVAVRQPRSGGFGAGRQSRMQTDGPPKAYTLQEQFGYPFGLGDGELTRYAPAYMRYMQLSGAKREHLGTYSLVARAGANNNPNAMFYEQQLTMDDYMNCRMVADPLCLFDCDMPIDGAVAVVLARADIAKDMRQPPAYITAYGSAGWHWAHLLPDCSTEYTIDYSAGNTARTLWASTDLTQKDMDGAFFFDGFGSNIYFFAEAFGFAPKYEAWQWIQDGRIALGGELPINTHGGNLSEGRLGSLNHWVEATKQIQKRADNQPGDGARQIQGVENVLCVAMLGLGGRPTGVVLSSEPR